MHVPRDSVFNIFGAGGRAHPDMADDENPKKKPWKRQVTPHLTPAWMTASVARMEEERVETLDSARKKQRNTEGEEDEPATRVGVYVAQAAAVLGEPTASSSASEPPTIAEDMRKFRYASMTPASFQAARHLFMCVGRPFVVPCLMY